jgi:Flp pilus assembly protein TadB
MNAERKQFILVCLVVILALGGIVFSIVGWIYPAVACLLVAYGCLYVQIKMHWAATNKQTEEILNRGK